MLGTLNRWLLDSFNVSQPYSLMDLSHLPPLAALLPLNMPHSTHWISEAWPHCVSGLTLIWLLVFPTDIQPLV